LSEISIPPSLFRFRRECGCLITGEASQSLGGAAPASASSRGKRAAMTNMRLGAVPPTSAGAVDVVGGVSSRTELLKRSVLLGGTALAGGGLATALAQGGRLRSLTARDAQILNYVLRLERLKAAFYREAAGGGALTGELQKLAEILARHERAHVSFLRKHLGGKAEGKRTYDFGDATRNPDTFSATAGRLEETAVAAYIGQGANLTRSLMVPFAQLCSVEARHAAWIADLLERDPAPRAADEAKPPKDVLQLIDETGFEANG
jgi:rubrerythrin